MENSHRPTPSRAATQLLAQARGRRQRPDSRGGTTAAGTDPQISAAGTVQLCRSRPPAQLHTPDSGLGTNRAGRIAIQHVCSRGARMADTGYQHRSIQRIDAALSGAPSATALALPGQG